MKIKNLQFFKDKFNSNEKDIYFNILQNKNIVIDYKNGF